MGADATPEFMAIADQIFQAAAKKDNTGRVQAAYDAVNQSDYVIQLSPCDGCEGASPYAATPEDESNGKGTGGIGVLDIDGIMNEDGYHTREDVAAHLLSHLEDIVTGTVDHSGSPPNREQKATRIENRVANPPKTTYKGQPVPTAIPPIPKKPEKAKPGTGHGYTQGISNEMLAWANGG